MFNRPHVEDELQPDEVGEFHICHHCKKHTISFKDVFIFCFLSCKFGNRHCLPKGWSLTCWVQSSFRRVCRFLENNVSISGFAILTIALQNMLHAKRPRIQWPLLMHHRSELHTGFCELKKKMTAGAQICTACLRNIEQQLQTLFNGSSENSVSYMINSTTSFE